MVEVVDETEVVKKLEKKSIHLYMYFTQQPFLVSSLNTSLPTKSEALRDLTKNGCETTERIESGNIVFQVYSNCMGIQR